MSAKEFVKIVGMLVVALVVLSAVPLEAQANHPDDKKYKIPSVNLALSGGGLRASAFSYGVMLELERFCVEGDKDVTGSKILVYKKLPLWDTEPEKPSPCSQGQSLLDQLHYLSAVSGGAITAGYYQTHTKEEFLEQYGEKLREFNFPMNLVLHADTSLKSFSFNRYLRAPAHLVTSIVDIITTFVLSPFRLFTSFDVELTPFATMTLSDGLLESARLVNVYNDNFFESATFQQINAKDTQRPFIEAKRPESSSSKPELLINATDIRNGRVFTFDRDTFQCLGASTAYRDMPIAVAAAAASSLPGVFTPVNLKQYLNGNTPDRIPSHCPTILGDAVRSPVLVDGGVSDNLGVLGILGRIFGEKNQQAMPENPNPKEKRAFIIAVNAAVNSDSTLPGIAKQLDGSFDVLMRDKTAISSEMASGLMRNFGLGTVVISYSDLVHNNEIVRMIARDLYGRVKRDALGESSFQDEMSRTSRYTEMEQKVLEDLNHISMLPNKSQIDTLIAAGRAAVAERHKEIETLYKVLEEKKFTSCPRVVNPAKEYCWPKEFELPHLMSNSTGEIVHQISRVSEQFAQSTIETRKQYVDFLKTSTRAYVYNADTKKQWETYHLIYPVRITEDQCLPLLFGQSRMDCDLSAALNHHLSPLAHELWKTIEITKATESNANMIGTKEIAMANNKRTIRAGLQNLRECNKCDQTPWHYIALSRLYRNLGEGELTIQTLEKGLSQFPEDMNLLHDLGIALINAEDRHDYSGGLHYLKLAREMAKSTQIRLVRLGAMGQKEEQFRQDQLKRFKNAELKFAIDIAFYASVASHLPPGKAQYISDAEVLLWLQEHYQWDRAKNKISAEDTEQTENSAAGDFLIDRPASQLASLYAKNKKDLTEVEKARTDDLEGYLIQSARAFMAEKSYMNDAVKFARDVYTTRMQESFLSQDYRSAPIQDALPLYEVLDIYGFTILMSTAEQSCPQRQPSVEQAQALFESALTTLSSPTNLYEEVWKERILMHQYAAQKLSCSAA